MAESLEVEATQYTRRDIAEHVKRAAQDRRLRLQQAIEQQNRSQSQGSKIWWLLVLNHN